MHCACGYDGGVERSEELKLKTVLTTKRTKDTKVQEYYFFISYFVLFVSFVVRCLLRFWLRLRRVGIFAALAVKYPSENSFEALTDQEE